MNRGSYNYSYFHTEPSVRPMTKSWKPNQYDEQTGERMRTKFGIRDELMIKPRSMKTNRKNIFS